MLGYSRFEDVIGLGLEYAERWKFRWWPVFLVKTSEVKALMMRECLISDDLDINEYIRCLKYDNETLPLL
jgi:hypothetical protein